ncbi:hypothetical protein BDZ91DRAFT_710142 [Kalaharituber pfeilii]|nr:hypothetical protein BDZ91DRAFT_710142 [Kalaharituber pfeilii]
MRPLHGQPLRLFRRAHDRSHGMVGGCIGADCRASGFATVPPPRPPRLSSVPHRTNAVSQRQTSLPCPYRAVNGRQQVRLLSTQSQKASSTRAVPTKTDVTSPISTASATESSPRLPTFRLIGHPIPVPGFDQLVKLVIYLDDKIGTSLTNEELVTAYHELLMQYVDENHVVKPRRELLEEHAYVLMRTHEYLWGIVSNATDDVRRTDATGNPLRPSPLPLEILARAIQVVHATQPQEPAAVRLSKLLFSDLASRRDLPTWALRSALVALQAAKTPEERDVARMLFDDITSHPDYSPLPMDCFSITRTLMNTKENEEALLICTSAWEKYREAAVTTEVWEELLRGYARVGDEEGFNRVWDLIVKYGVIPDAGMWHQRIAVHCEVKNGRGLESARYWWHRLKHWPNLQEPELDTYEMLLRFYCRRDKRRLADELLWYMMTRDEEKGPPQGSKIDQATTNRWWRAVARWACGIGVGMEAAGIKPGLDSVNYVFQRMTRCHKTDRKKWIPLPDADMVNDVVRYVLQNERWVFAGILMEHLTRRWDIAPNREMLSLWTQYLITQDELKEARKTYEEMKKYPIPAKDDAIELRQLIRALVVTNIEKAKKIPPTNRGQEYKPPGLHDIEYFLADLEDRKLGLDIDTTISLVKYHLATHYLDLLPPLLYSTVPTFSHANLTRLVPLFIEHIQDPQTSLMSAWDSYLIMYNHFPASVITPEMRNVLMETFFSLGRSDMAITILTHTPSRPPIPLSLYVTALNGVAKTRDLENLRLVHNLINLSPSVPSPPPTNLLNALMNAYGLCDLHERAMRFWGTIRRSRAGPDHESISIVIEICGRRRGWLDVAKEIWRTLEQYKIVPTLANYLSYVNAHLAHEQWGAAWDFVKRMEEEDGVAPDEKILTTLYTSSPSDLQPQIAQWAKAHYPTIFPEQPFIKPVQSGTTTGEVAAQSNMSTSSSLGSQPKQGGLWWIFGR